MKKFRSFRNKKKHLSSKYFADPYRRVYCCSVYESGI